MGRFFLKLYRYVYFRRAQKNKDNPAFMQRNQGLSIGSYFPDAADMPDYMKIKERNGFIVLFLSMTCQACIEILNEMNALAERWPNQSIILFINGHENEFEGILTEYRAEVLIIKYEHTQFQLYKTTIFPYMYYLSTEGMIVAKGTINHVAQIDQIINQGIESVQLTRSGGEDI